MALTLSVLQRLFAPFLPYVTDEVWSWWHDESIHVAAWPTVREFGDAGAGSDEKIYPAVSDVLALVRRAKTEAKVSQRAAVARCEVRAEDAFVDAVRSASADLRDAGSIENLDLMSTAGELAVDVTFAVN